jgi:20S proteasome alpha/beta subunit
MLRPLPVPRLPKPSLKPYIRPIRQENKAMTVVVGLRCKDGIVICADQQVTSPGSHKYNECKINIETVHREPVVFAYSGLPSLAREAREKMLNKIGDEEPTDDLVREAADAVLTDVGRTWTDVDLRMLIGINRTLEDPTLYKFDGRGLHVADNYSLLGFGESALIRYFIETMYSPDLGLDDATNLALYLVQKAEDYIDGCGGPIDVAILKAGVGESRSLTRGDIEKRIRAMEKQESRLIDLIVRQSFSS